MRNCLRATRLPQLLERARLEGTFERGELDGYLFTGLSASGQKNPTTRLCGAACAISLLWFGTLNLYPELYPTGFASPKVSVLSNKTVCMGRCPVMPATADVSAIEHQLIAACLRRVAGARPAIAMVMAEL